MTRAKDRAFRSWVREATSRGVAFLGWVSPWVFPRSLRFTLVAEPILKASLYVENPLRASVKCIPLCQLGVEIYE